MKNNIVRFLNELSVNNNVPWMHQNKKWYLEVKAEFQNIVQLVIDRLIVVDPSIIDINAKDTLFRINRNQRFSKDKTPYHTNLRSYISHDDSRDVTVGYYLFLSANRIYIEGGYYNYYYKEATKRVRDYIAVNGEEFLDIVTDPNFLSLFNLKGTKLVNVPKGYSKDEDFSEYLKYKCWYVETGIDVSRLNNIKLFVDEVVEKYTLMIPFNNFLKSALEGYKFIPVTV